MLQPSPLMLRVRERTPLQGSYEIWQFSRPATCSDPTPGHWLEWTSTEAREQRRGFLMGADDATLTALSRTPEGRPNVAPTAEIRLMQTGGTAWPISAATSRGLMLVEESALASAVFFAARLRRQLSSTPQLLVVAQWNVAPLKLQPSRVVIPHLPPGAIAAVPLLEDWHIASRVADPTGRPGCFEGQAVELAEYYLSRLDWAYRATLPVWAAGGDEFIAAATSLADRYGLSAHVSRAP